MNCVTRTAAVLWGIWGWVSFALAVSFALIVTMAVPGPERRRRLVTGAAKATFVMARVRVIVRGIDNLPADSCIVVANHASNLDGILLKGYLPPRFSFVIKGEMRAIPVVHFLLRRAGSKFVERNEISGSSRDARQIVKAAVGGESLAFFPEGTFIKEPGIGRFRAGAFVAAVKGGLPVVPVAISGARDILPSGRILPRRTDLTIEILPAIAPGDEGFNDSKTLSALARQRILAVLDEPDLL